MHMLDDRLMVITSPDAGLVWAGWIPVTIHREVLWADLEAPTIADGPTLQACVSGDVPPYDRRYAMAAALAAAALCRGRDALRHHVLLTPEGGGEQARRRAYSIVVDTGGGIVLAPVREVHAPDASGSVVYARRRCRALAYVGHDMIGGGALIELTPDHMSRGEARDVAYVASLMLRAGAVRLQPTEEE
jgi:hypothetical protein